LNKTLIFLFLGILSLILSILLIKPQDFLNFSNISQDLILLSIVIYLSSFLFRTIRWKLLILPFAGKVSFRVAFWMICVSLMINSLLPVKLGEVFRAYLLKLKERVNFLEALSSVIVERLLDILILAIIGIIGLNLIPESLPSWIQQSTRVTGFVVSGLMGLFLLGLVKKELFLKKWVSLLKFLKFPEEVIKRGEKALESLFSGAKGLSIKSLPIIILTLLIWLAHLGWIYYTFQAFDIKISPLALSLGLVLVTLGTLVPSPPAYLGTFEALWLGVFLALGVSDIKRLLSLILLAHLINVGLVLILGSISLLFLGLSFREVLKVRKIGV